VAQIWKVDVCKPDIYVTLLCLFQQSSRLCLDWWWPGSRRHMNPWHQTQYVSRLRCASVKTYVIGLINHYQNMWSHVSRHVQIGMWVIILCRHATVPVLKCFTILVGNLWWHAVALVWICSCTYLDMIQHLSKHKKADQ